MQEEIIMSGFGGQGALFAGQLLAYTAMDAGKEVTWIPSYGPEMRGGTAHCTVIISDEPIGSPIVRQPSIAIAMNLPSHGKYGALVRPGGLLVVNARWRLSRSAGADIDELRIAASDIASELGDVRMSNVVLLGALLRRSAVLPIEAMAAAWMRMWLDEQDACSSRTRRLCGAALKLPAAHSAGLAPGGRTLDVEAAALFVSFSNLRERHDLCVDATSLIVKMPMVARYGHWIGVLLCISEPALQHCAPVDRRMCGELGPCDLDRAVEDRSGAEQQGSVVTRHVRAAHMTKDDGSRLRKSLA